MTAQHGTQQVDQSFPDNQSPPGVPCIACGSLQNTHFFTLPSLPVNVGYSALDVASAKNADFGRVELVYCHHCTHVFNRAFEPDRIRYEPGYEVSLNHSPVFRKFMEGLAGRLLDTFKLKGKSLVEIGSGRGWFLSLLCESGDNRGLGIDPSTPVEGKLSTQRGQVELFRSYFSDSFEQRFQELCADFVCCLSVFEHVPQPLEFLQRLRRFIGDRQVGLYWEVFNAERAIREREIWSILYEQCSYFSLRSLTSIMRRAGFNVQAGGSCYEQGQYLFVEGHSASQNNTPMNASEANGGLPIDDASTHILPEEIQQFADHFREKLRSWSERLDVFRARNMQVVFWGSGGKGVSFLNLLNTGEQIAYVAEINPDKQGKYIPGTGQRIVAPEFLRQYRPDVIIISNALYQAEIAAHASALGLDCPIYVA